MQLSDVFTMEYRMSQHCMDTDTADFCEGIRARMFLNTLGVILRG